MMGDTYPEMSTSVPWSLVKGGFRKAPQYSSLTQKPVAGRGRASLSLMPFATWNFSLDLNYVSGGEAVADSVLQAFLGCFMQCRGGAQYHAPITYAPVVHAVDATGEQKMLDDHSKAFQRHVERTLRKMNGA